MHQEEQEQAAVIIPSAMSLLCWAETRHGEPLEQVYVESLLGQAPAMQLPVPVTMALNESRSVPDIDPQEAWSQWSCLRRKIDEQGLAIDKVVPEPLDQLSSDIRALSEILPKFEVATPEVVSHQLKVMDDYARQFVEALASTFPH
ncbi:MAG: hypothetical protein AAGC44_11505 [Planctomycetota bacterium]